jgi:SAM-dependent methyltransferase
LSPLTIAQQSPTHPDLEAEFMAAQAVCQPFTMTSIERRYALWQAIHHVVKRRVEGAFVECGVWRGGSTMVAAIALRLLGADDRELWLYDTFEGMSEPTEHDVEAATGMLAGQHPDIVNRVIESNVFAYAELDDVRFNVARTGYPDDRIRYVQGKVEDTLPQYIPDRIAVLRLDTDWYESTRHELEHLWDRLAPGGVLIIDDYGHWAGARKAVDEFFAGRDDAPLLSRIDYPGRIGVKR